MAELPADAERLLKPFELGLRVAHGRRREKISQAAFAEKLGVSRKTISDLERGTAEHVSLKTAMAALSLAGFVLYSAQRRPPTMDEILARRSADRTRADKLLNSGTTHPSVTLTELASSPPLSPPRLSAPTLRRKRRS
jgi:transcriptional regulator with XRE-family HTH domain